MEEFTIKARAAPRSCGRHRDSQALPSGAATLGTEKVTAESRAKCFKEYEETEKPFGGGFKYRRPYRNTNLPYLMFLKDLPFLLKTRKIDPKFYFPALF